MAEIATTRGDAFVKILIREYQTLLDDARRAVIRYRRLLEEYHYTPTQVREEQWRASQHYKDVEHYTKVLAHLKGAENGEPIPAARTQAETPKAQQLFNSCTSGM